MATVIKVQPNQSMQDVAINATGSMEAGMQFCLDNGVSISDTPVVGTVYVVSDAALALGDAGNLKYLQQNDIVVGTLGDGVPPPPVPVTVFQAGRSAGVLSAYAVTAFTMVDAARGITVVFPFSPTLAVIEEDSDEAAFMAYLEGIKVGAGMLGFLTMDAAGLVTYTNALGEGFAEVTDVVVMVSRISAVFDATLGGKVKTTFLNGKFIVKWNDGSDYEYEEDVTGAGGAMIHTYTLGTGIVKGDMFHNDDVEVMLISDQLAVPTAAPLKRFGGGTKFPGKRMDQLKIELNPYMDAIQSIPVDECAGVLKYLFVSANATVASFSTSLFNVPMPGISWISLTNNNLSSAALDAAVMNFVANSWDGVRVVTWNGDHNAGTYTAASAAARAAIVLAGGTVT